MFIFLITLCSCFIANLSYSRKATEESIVGIWKHHEDQVFLIFWENNKMSLRIPLNYEVMGRYRIIEKRDVEIVFLPQSYLMSGELIKSEPQPMKLTIYNNKLYLYGIEKDKLEGELFIKVL